MAKFECLKCGKCCENFIDSEKNTKGLPLFEWEKIELEKLAKEKSINLKILPFKPVYDKKSDSYICVNFSLEQQPCPFLENNQCSIYEKRPIACRSFPLAKNPLIEKIELDSSCFLDCPSFSSQEFLKNNFQITKEKPIEITRKKFIKEYKETFGKETLVYQTIESNLRDYSNKIMNELIITNQIKLRKVSSLDYPHIKPTPFFEFLVKIGLFNDKTKEEIIKQLSDFNIISQILDSWEN